jgi:hypothetical protein
MTSPRPQYVSPSLRPTSPWAQQTSTGTFRPPPPLTLTDSRQKKPEIAVARSWESAPDDRRVTEKIVELLVEEVRLERESFAIHQAKNRDLDRMLRREQDERKALMARGDHLRGEVKRLQEHLQLQKNIIDSMFVQ